MSISDTLQKAIDEIKRLRSDNKELREILLDVVIQATSDGDRLDSMALTSYATAMRYLSECGLIEIESEYGRRVIGRLTGSKP